MTSRIWAAILLLVALLTAAVQIDRPIAANLPPVNTASVSANPAVTALRACAGSQAASIGPLVPGQDLVAGQTSIVNAPDINAISPAGWSSRAGFSISTSTDPGLWAGLLGAGWYLDWTVQAGSLPAGPVHWQMVRVHQGCIIPAPEVIKLAATSHPGQVWVIGNEPDVIWQDNVTPEAYAAYYHDVYTLLKSSDQTALIAVGGISQATPLRFQYLDRVLQTYQDLYHAPLPADWWTLHGYVLREEKGSWGVEIPPGIDATRGELYEVIDHGRLDLFENQVIAFRQWMFQHGYQATPLALTEFGILMPNSYGFPPEFIATYLDQTFSWLYQARDSSTGYPADSFHLVQKWAWFSVSDPTYSSSNLGDLSSNRLTDIGERFRDVVLSMER